MLVVQTAHDTTDHHEGRVRQTTVHMQLQQHAHDLSQVHSLYERSPPFCLCSTAEHKTSFDRAMRLLHPLPLPLPIAKSLSPTTTPQPPHRRMESRVLHSLPNTIITDPATNIPHDKRRHGPDHVHARRVHERADADSRPKVVQAWGGRRGAVG